MGYTKPAVVLANKLYTIWSQRQASTYNEIAALNYVSFDLSSYFFSNLIPIKHPSDYDVIFLHKYLFLSHNPVCPIIGYLSSFGWLRGTLELACPKVD